MLELQNANFHVINIVESFTPKIFYEYYLEKLGEYIRKNWEAKRNGRAENWLFIDLSECKEIEGTVIPNLLVTGIIIKKNTGKEPILYIPENGENKIMRYLKGIQFDEINEFLDIFYIKTNGGRGKNSKYELPDFCTTLYLSEKLSEEKVSEELQKKYLTLFTEYLGEFIYAIKNDKTQRIEFVNLLEIFCKQICYNAIIHGKSFCFVTMQVNRSRKKIFISISDCGKGMYEDFKDKILYEGYQPILLPQNVEEIKKNGRYEIDSKSIIEGIMYRFNDPIYGLWNVIKSVMDVNGIMRFHSGKARVVLSGLECKIYDRYEKRRATEMFYKKIKTEKCISKTPDYAGTHIEIELPLKA